MLQDTVKRIGEHDNAGLLAVSVANTRARLEGLASWAPARVRETVVLPLGEACDSRVSFLGPQPVLHGHSQPASE